MQRSPAARAAARIFLLVAGCACVACGQPAFGTSDAGSGDGGDAGIAADGGSDAGAADAGSPASAMIEICVLDPGGTFNPDHCSHITDSLIAIPQVDFGSIALNSVTTQTLRIINQGGAELTFDPQPHLASGSIFQLSSLIPNGQLDPGASADLSLTAAPTGNVSGAQSAGLAIDCNDPRAGSLTVDLLANVQATGCSSAQDPSAAVAAYYSLTQTGVYLPFDWSVRPGPLITGDWIDLNASTSSADTAPSFSWTIVSAPVSETTSFTGQTLQLNATAAGDYVVELTVADSAGCTGTEQITLQVNPPP